ncbi:hypothetical protein ES703_62585 [subsurface metagenome]
MVAMDITTNNRLETVPQRKYVLAGYTRYVHFCSLVWTSCFYPDKKQISTCGISCRVNFYLRIVGCYWRIYFSAESELLMLT